METASRRGRRRERLVGAGERVSDAFGLVLILVLVTYVLASRSKIGVGARCSSPSPPARPGGGTGQPHARAGLVRGAIVLSGLTVLLAAIGAAADNRTWLNLATLIQVHC